MNILGAAAVALSVWAFVFAYKHLRRRAFAVRLGMFCALAALAIPAVTFALYYLHLLPELAWFYTLRSWRGTEFLVVFLGFAGGAAASLLPRVLLALPLAVLLALAVVPHIKPLIGPIHDEAFQERWQEGACIQSTPSTCGPASVTTILRQLGTNSSEQEAARAAFSYVGGTEAWYLARYVRSKGFAAQFDFRETFNPAVGLPAVVGVRMGGVGHFIAVLGVNGDQVTFADPLHGQEHLSLSEFQRRYVFTGFHMVITRG